MVGCITFRPVVRQHIMVESTWERKLFTLWGLGNKERMGLVF